MSDENKNLENENEDEKYSLYTEHIIPEHGKKIRRFIKKGIYVLATAVFFGLVAGLVMVIVYKTGKEFTEPESTKETITLSSSDTSVDNDSSEDVGESTTHEEVIITTAETTQAETTTEASLIWDEDVLEELNEVTDIYNAMKNVAIRVNQSMVTVTAIEDGVDWLNATYQNASDEYGVLIAEDAQSYYILTDYSLVCNAEQIKITFANGEVQEGSFITGDVTTGFGIVKTNLVSSEQVKSAVLGDSSAVEQGDVLVAVGKLYGFVDSMAYGIATGINSVVYDTDATFKLINTSINGTETSTGVVANLNGDVVGIITTNYNTGTTNLVSIYPISDMHTLLENLINGIDTPYLGIKGQDVTQEIMDTYEVPAGIYVTTIETNSPAYKAGIQTGDVITSINGIPVSSMNGLIESIHGTKVGDIVDIIIQRKGRYAYKEIVFSVTLGVE